MAPGLEAPTPPAVVRPAGPPAAPRLRPEVALAAARAAAKAGRPSQALALLRQAIPQAGPLADILRLEAAGLAVAQGEDPYPYLAPMLSPRAPAAVRRHAEDVARHAVATLPPAKAKAWLGRPLPAALKRQAKGTLVQRQQDVAGMFKLLEEKSDDLLAGELARALLDKELSRQHQELVASALFSAGYWQESHRLLARIPFQPGERFSLTFLRARTAYRLQAWGEAIFWFEKAERATADPEEKASCWLFAARAWEQLGQPACAHELYRQIVTLRAEAVEGWTGLLLLLARQDQGWPAVAALKQAPSTVYRELAPRLCAALVMRGHLAAAQYVVSGSNAEQPALQLCQGFLALHLGRQEEAQRLWAKLLANPQAGRLRELVALALPLTVAGALPKPTRELGELSLVAVEKGVATARLSLLEALRQDPAFSPLFAEKVPAPVLPQGLEAMLAAGFTQEVATVLPHLLPQETPSELAWSAAFLAEAGNLREAGRLGERLWAKVGPIPASLLPEELLPHILPKAFKRLLPEGCSRLHALLLAIARQESRFDARAFSPTGARGVWQLMPATIARLAPENEAASGQTNSGVWASRHLEASARQLGADPLLLAAAYNAGDSWVELWLGQDAGSHPLFALAVPYAETRGYLLAVTEGLFLARHLE